MTPKIPAEPNPLWGNTLACIGNPLLNLRHPGARHHNSILYGK
jgi:hypothetical protein